MALFHRRSFLMGLASLSALPVAGRAYGQATGGADNEAVVRELYRIAEGANLDPEKFASLFADDGYFMDMPSGQKWVGKEVREPVSGLIAAYPDIHRELTHIYSTADNVVVVELRLKGTHKGDLPLPDGVLRATGKRFDVPCCDVWRLEQGKVKSFHCYNSLVASLKEQANLGVKA